MDKHESCMKWGTHHAIRVVKRVLRFEVAFPPQSRGACSVEGRRMDGSSVGGKWLSASTTLQALLPTEIHGTRIRSVGLRM